MSDLSDSAAYMREKDSGVETRLRENVPHLLDIDGEVCHHQHNVKEFPKPFEKHVEKHFDDLHTDTKWSHDIMDNLKERCLILDEPYKKPPRRIPHRWLSTFDCAQTLIHMLNSLLVLYFDFMPEKCDNECSQEMYRQEYRQILVDKKVNIAGKKSLKRIRAQFKGKKMTKKGEERKKRRYGKLWGYEGYDRSHHTAVFGCFPDGQFICISF